MPPQIISQDFAQAFNRTNIHILGSGAIGCYIGTALRCYRNRVTLLLRSQSRVDEFEAQNNSIVYGHVNKPTHVISGFHASAVDDVTDNSPITSLVICTKSIDLLQAIKPIASRITSQTTIVFFQNGYGFVQQLINYLWADTAPPTIFVAVNRNSVARLSTFNICHHSGHSDPDAIRIGQYPIQGQAPAKDCFLIQKITEIPGLHAALLPWPELLSKLYKKLILNACVNPIAGILECTNGKIIMSENKNGVALIESVLSEACQVLGDSIIDETYDSLLKMVLNGLEETKEFSCSTLQDVMAKRMTEIEYLNGYICKLGTEKNISVKANQTILSLVHFKECLYKYL